MSHRQVIESQLGNIYNWLLVSYKKNILRSLEKVFDDGEVIHDLLDGLWGENGTASGIGTSGVLIITDRRLLFIESEKSRGCSEVIMYNSITGISYGKRLSSTVLTITCGDRELSFKSFANDTAVRKFVDTFRTLAGSGADFKEERAANIIDTMTELFAERIMRSGAEDDASGKTKGTLGKTDETDALIDEVDTLNLLFTEAGKIRELLRGIEPLWKDHGLRESVIEDIIVLSALCNVNGGPLTQEEHIFMSLVLMPLDPEDDENVREQVREMYGFSGFPLHMKNTIEGYRDVISRYISSRHITKGRKSLHALPALRSYDREHGTGYADSLGSALYLYSQCFMKADGTLKKDEEERLRELHALIYNAEEGDAGAAVEGEAVQEETLEEVMEQIHRLVGMEKIKEQIATLVNLIKIEKERKVRNLPATPVSLHSVFYGPPGTGKTTIARLLGRVFRCLGILEKGQLIETDRAGLVAGYVGQTAARVDEVVQSALDGVLFIDEAYTLSPEDSGGRDFGQEAIDTVLKRMEDYRERFIVIVAGYPDEMERFINSNPGLKSRFNRFFFFDHYRPDELMSIFDIFCENAAFSVDDEAREDLLALITAMYESRDRRFGNGRFVRNVFERIVERQANRIAGITPLTDEILCTIRKDDIPERDDIIS